MAKKTQKHRPPKQEELSLQNLGNQKTESGEVVKQK